MVQVCAEHKLRWDVGSKESSAIYKGRAAMGREAWYLKKKNHLK